MLSDKQNIRNKVTAQNAHQRTIFGKRMGCKDVSYLYGATPLMLKCSAFLNQVRAGLWPARSWFFEIAFVQEVSMCVCVRPRGYE